MKKALLGVILVLALLLAACGGAGANQLQFQSIDRGDDSITAEISFDQAYENVTVFFHSDVDNDAFTGTADYSEELGAVEPGQVYTVTATTGNGWTYDGIFKNVSLGNGTFSVNPPDLADETIVITLKDGETELLSEETTR